MMMKEKSSPWARLKYLYVLPVAAVAVAAFARPEVSRVTGEISSAKINAFSAIAEKKAAESVADTLKPAYVKHVPVEVREELKGTPLSVYEVVEEMPEFPEGGMAGLMDYFKKNMRYPEAAKQQGRQGRVVVQFVVDKDGSIRDAGILRGEDEALNAEALRLVNSMPKWKPGRQQGEPVAVKYTVPVVFRGNGDARDAGTPSAEKEPLCIVDGKEVTEAIVSALDPAKIKSVTVLKDKSSLAPYGEKGKNGVILMSLKPEKEPVAVSVGVQKEVGLPGIGGIYTGGKKADWSKMPVYVDGVKVDKPLNEVNSDNIEGVEVKKNPDGTGSIHITTKKYVGQADKEAMKVNGKVVDEQGEPIIGATVLLEGTDKGTVSDVDGNFRLPVPAKEAVLEVSYIGMATAKVKAQPQLTVTLKNE